MLGTFCPTHRLLPAIYQDGLQYKQLNMSSTNKKYFCLIGLIFSSALFIIGVKNISNDICKDSRAPLFLVITGAIILGKMMFNSLLSWGKY